MRIGIIGSGTMGRTLGKLLATLGYDVLFGSHDSQRVGVWIESERINARAGTYSDAAEFGDIIFLVTLWPDTKTAI